MASAIWVSGLQRGLALAGFYTGPINGIYDQATRWGSVLPAVWSFMLALRARGLGSCWTTIHLHREEEMAELLGIPYGEVTQAGMFPVAASADVVHWNRW